MDVFHIEIIGCDCVGHGILGKDLGLLHCVPGGGLRREEETLELELTESLALDQVREDGSRV